MMAKSGEILVNGHYNILRKDRSNDTIPNKKDGGEVITAVTSSLSAKRRTDLEEAIEIIWGEVQVSQSRSILLELCI